MVKVWYEPPPFGPGTSLNRPSYGIVTAKPGWIQSLSRRPQGMVVAGACVTFIALAYVPISELYLYWIIIVYYCYDIS